jgi:protein phosphatase
MKGQYYPNPIDALNGSLQFANMQILGFADAHPEYKGMGTTACIVLMRDNDVWIAHAGDSRIYLYLGKERQLHRITRDHSLVQTLVDSGQITDDEAEHHPNKNRILKALGIKPELKPTFNHLNQPIHPKNGDIFLICTDGLCGMISDNTIERVLGDNTSLANKGEVLISLAMQGEIVQPGGQDNCTLELIQIDGSPFKESQFHSENPVGRPQGGQGGKGSRKKTTIILAAVAAVVLATIVGLTALFIINSKKDKEKELETKLAQQTQDSIDAEKKKTTLEKEIKDIRKQIDSLTTDSTKNAKILNNIKNAGKDPAGILNSTRQKQNDITSELRSLRHDKKMKEGALNECKQTIKNTPQLKEQLKKEYGINTQQTTKEYSTTDKTDKETAAGRHTNPSMREGDNNHFSEEAQLDKEFADLYSQLNTKENTVWRNNVFNSVLDKGCKREMSVLKNLWQN